MPKQANRSQKSSSKAQMPLAEEVKGKTRGKRTRTFAVGPPVEVGIALIAAVAPKAIIALRTGKQGHKNAERSKANRQIFHCGTSMQYHHQNVNKKVKTKNVWYRACAVIQRAAVTVTCHRICRP